MAKTNSKVPAPALALAPWQAMAAAAAGPSENPRPTGPHDLRPTSTKYKDQSYSLEASTCSMKTIVEAVAGKLGPEVKVRFWCCKREKLCCLKPSSKPDLGSSLWTS
ncbi:hypothetical protein GUJ93_ZPchr0016g2632 [Zizania palustris]|uniref:Uncharacterized protein n=1 Tax=Zizania palustris TaxID=103762 RepID=A0A8J5W677_ZIZPA|nr:hypothetical protein GUJ93_ZPchr0016g2632 [Zizania palustris]